MSKPVRPMRRLLVADGAVGPGGVGPTQALSQINGGEPATARLARAWVLRATARRPDTGVQWENT